jgi:hypothetical protein
LAKTAFQDIYLFPGNTFLPKPFLMHFVISNKYRRSRVRKGFSDIKLYYSLESRLKKNITVLEMWSEPYMIFILHFAISKVYTIYCFIKINSLILIKYTYVAELSN